MRPSGFSPLLFIGLAALVCLPACAPRGGDRVMIEPPPIDRASRLRCEAKAGDKRDLRACLVPAGADHDASKQVGPDCYWRKFDSANVKFHARANGSNRRFTFEVINLCGVPVDVQMEFAAVADAPVLEFVTVGCGISDQQPLWSIGPLANANATCDSARYRYKRGARIYKRDVKFYARYNDQKVYFDPEIAVKDAE